LNWRKEEEEGEEEKKKRELTPHAVPCTWAELLYDVFMKIDGDERLSDLMSSWWVDFAKTSDPNSKKARGGKIPWPQWKGRRR